MSRDFGARAVPARRQPWWSQARSSGSSFVLAGRRRLLGLGRSHANVLEAGTVLKRGRHGPKYATELLPIKN